MYDEIHTPNWLFRGLILLSVGVHLLLLAQFAAIYRPTVVSKIELTLRSIIPRPHHQILRPPPQVKPNKDPLEQTIPAIHDTQDMAIIPSQYHAPRPIDRSRLVQSTPMPKLSTIEDPDVIVWQDEPEILPKPSRPNLGEDILPEKDYTDGVQQQIDAAKEYPQRAQRRHIAGVVDVLFVIGSNGEILSIDIAKSSGSRILDRSAIKAVKKAAPFDKPPNGKVTIRAPIKFELIGS